MPLAPLPRGTSLDDWVAAQAGAGAGDAGDLRAVFFALASATRRVAAALARAGLDDALGAAAGGDEAVAQGRDAPKQLDVVAVRERERERRGSGRARLPPTPHPPPHAL
jgi:hypothetical protein